MWIGDGLGIGESLMPERVLPDQILNQTGRPDAYGGSRKSEFNHHPDSRRRREESAPEAHMLGQMRRLASPQLRRNWVDLNV
jgi:hypothetical protein